MWSIVESWSDDVVAAAHDAVDRACTPGSTLHRWTQAVVGRADRTPGHVSLRLFGIAVHGAITGEPAPAVPIGAISHLWWAAAEVLDDLVDTEVSFEDLPSTSSASLLTTAIACLTQLPQAVVEQAPPRVRDRWTDELVRTSLRAAQGQLDDEERGARATTWRHVMTSYVGKTGAAYGRDAAMAAWLAGDDATAVARWRTFGEVFGVLRQTYNDNVHNQSSVELDEDLANGVPTLLVAHALDVLPQRRKDDLTALRALAGADLDARRAVRSILHAEDVTAGYVAKLATLHDIAARQLDELAPHAAYRDALRERLDEAAAYSNPANA